MGKSLDLVILGCGRLGSMLATHFSQQGHKVIVIDSESSAFDSLQEGFSGFALSGNVGEVEVLQQAKLEQADCVLAVTGKDNLNIMVSQLAKTMFHVPIVLTRMSDPALGTIYQQLGLIPINTTKISAEAFVQTLQQHLSGRV